MSSSSSQTILPPTVLRRESTQSDIDVEMTGMSNVAPTAPEATPFGSDTRSTESTPGAAVSTSDTTLRPPNTKTNAIGAGPLPTGYGMQPGLSTGSTLTEFTKRRNWSRLILEELRDLLLILSPDGRMQFISPSCKLLIGHESNTLKSRFLVELIHPDDQSMFRRELNEAIASQNQMRFFYRIKKADETYAIFEAFGHPHFGTEILNGYGVSESARYCRVVFLISRPYPTKNAALLDSFLEHKIENERLVRKIEELKKEEKLELEQSDRTWSRKDTYTSMSASEDQRTEGGVETDTGATPAYNEMPPPPRPTISNTALTRQNLNDALAASKPDSINDKMARYEGATPMEHIEMLTGLRHGERAEGISTGATSPALIRGDAGIAILADRENRLSSDKKKKIKLVDEYVCTDCGTLDSPEWRKGPNGPKTLCNACGRKFDYVS
jgi:PAS domain S-box-containing protein